MNDYRDELAREQDAFTMQACSFAAGALTVVLMTTAVAIALLA